METKCWLMLINVSLFLLPCASVYYNNEGTNTVELEVTKISRVNPAELEDHEDARYYNTLVHVKNLAEIKGDVSFNLSMMNEDEIVLEHYTTVTLKGDAQSDILFNCTLVDATSETLDVTDSEGLLLGSWQGEYRITDLRARIAMIKDKIIRLATGTLSELSPGRGDKCKQDDSPCFRKYDEFTVVPPRDIIPCHQYSGSSFVYCDKTFTNVLDMGETPSLMLLDPILATSTTTPSTKLTVKLSEKMGSIEIVTLDSDGIIINKYKDTKCNPSDIDETQCSMDVYLPTGTKSVTFVIIVLDDDDFVVGSSATDFPIRDFDTHRLAEDVVFVNWPKEGEKNIQDVSIRSKSNLFETNYKISSICTDGVCESYFVDIDYKEDESIAVVQIDNIQIGKTIPKDIPEGQSKIKSITITTEPTGPQTITTFEVVDSVLPPSAKLVDVSTDGEQGSNIHYHGNMNETADGYIYICIDDIGEFIDIRNFLLVEYNQTDGVQKIGAAYVPFISNDVQLTRAASDSILRVVVNSNDTVSIGSETCDRAESPCYFTEFDSKLNYIRVCTRVSNSAPIGGFVDECDDVEPFSPPDLKEDPLLILLDDTELIVSYEESYSKIELLILDANEEWISRNKGVDCLPSPSDSNACSFDVSTIKAEGNKLQVVVLAINQDGFVEGSGSYSFEIFDVETWRLTEDAIMTNWTSSEEKTFSVSIQTKSNFHESEYKITHICGGDGKESSNCQTFFINLDDKEKDYIAVIWDGTNSVAKSVRKEMPDHSSIIRILNTVESDGMETSFIFSGESEPASMIAIEVVVAGTEVSNIMHDGYISSISEGYAFNCTKDIGEFDHRRQFLFVEYTNDEVSGTIRKAGASYVTFLEYDVHLDWVANAAILRANVNDNKTITFGEDVCDCKDPCFITSFPSQTDYVLLCTPIQNEAPIGNTIGQCQDKQTHQTEDLEVQPSFTLLDESNMTLTYTNNYNKVEILVLDEDGKWISEDQGFDCQFLEFETKGCSLDIGALTGEQIVTIEVLSIKKDNSVDKSSSYQFQIFDVEALRLTEDATMTTWKLSEEKDFHVILKSKSDFENPVYSLNKKCGGTGTEAIACESFFVGLMELDFDIIVSISINEENIKIARTIPENELPRSMIFGITNSILSDNDMTSFMFNGTSKPDFIRAVDVTIEGEKVLSTEYLGNVTDVPGGYALNCSKVGNFHKKRKFVFLEYAEDQNGYQVEKSGAAYVEFIDYRIQLDWVHNDHILRVLVLDDIAITIGVETCDQKGVPYYITNFFSRDIYVSVCNEIKNEADDENLINQCEEKEPTTPPAIDEFVQFTLMEDTTLFLKYERYHAFVDVFPVDKRSEWLTKERNVHCDIFGVDGCIITISLAEPEDLDQFIVLFIDEEKKVIASKPFPFENFVVNAVRLTEESVMAQWISEEEKTFTVSVVNILDFNDRLYQMEATCGVKEVENNECESYFTNIDAFVDEYAVIVEIGNNAVAKSLPLATPEQLNLDFLSNGTSTNIVLTVFHFLESHPSSAKIIEVNNEASDDVINIHLSCNMNLFSNGHAFVCENITKISLTRRKFVFVEYDSAGNLQRAGAVFTDFDDFDVQMDWIADAPMLRVIVDNEDNVYISNDKCNETVSPCYITSVLGKTDFVLIGKEIENKAAIGGNYQWIDNYIAKTHPVLELKEVKLHEGSDTINLNVNGNFTEDASEVNLIIHTKDKAVQEDEIPCDFEIDQNTCRAEVFSLPSSPATLTVFVVSMNANGTVINSGTIDVEHLQFTVKELTQSSLMVHWMNASTGDYIAELMNDDKDPAYHKTVEVLCDNQNSCFALFDDLDLDKTYNFIANINGHSGALTDIDIGIQESEGKDLEITKITSVGDHETRMTLNEAVASEDIQICVTVEGPEMPLEVSGKGEGLGSSKKVFSFTHAISIFGRDNEVIFSLVGYDETTLIEKAVADLQLKTIDTKVAWVGDTGPSSTASLRVDVGSEDSAIVGNFTCSKELSPCYYIEEEHYPSPLENCVMNQINSQQILQCNDADEYFTQYEELIGVETSLHGDELEVTSPIDHDDAVLEVIVYDEGRAILSTGNTACDPPEKQEKQPSTIKCTQAVDVPTNEKPLKILVSEIGTDGTVLKSCLSDFKYPPEEGVAAWVIAVSVIGSLLFIILVLFIVAVKMKKIQIPRKRRPTKPSLISLIETQNPNFQYYKFDREEDKEEEKHEVKEIETTSL